MKNLTNGQNFQIGTKSKRLQAHGINHYCYVSVSGEDPNSVHAKDITAYGLQHATMITADDNSKDIEEKTSSVLIEDGERVLIDGVEYLTIYKGNYSDCVHFKEIKKRTEVRYIARHGEGYGKNHFSDLEFNTKAEAEAEIEKTGNSNNYWKEVSKHMYVEKVTKIYEEA